MLCQQVASTASTAKASQRASAVPASSARSSGRKVSTFAQRASASARVPAGPAPAPVSQTPLPGSRRSVLASASGAAGAGAGSVYDVVVVGGGISGLVTAQALVSKHGIKNFLVTEARERVGGNITTMSGDGFIWEEGPNSFQPNDSMLQIAVSSIYGCGI